MGTPELIQSTIVRGALPPSSWWNSSVHEAPTERHHPTADTDAAASTSDGVRPTGYFPIVAVSVVLIAVPFRSGRSVWSRGRRLELSAWVGVVHANASECATIGGGREC